MKTRRGGEVEREGNAAEKEGAAATEERVGRGSKASCTEEARVPFVINPCSSVDWEADRVDVGKCKIEKSCKGGDDCETDETEVGGENGGGSNGDSDARSVESEEVVEGGGDFEDRDKGGIDEAGEREADVSGEDSRGVDSSSWLDEDGDGRGIGLELNTSLSASPEKSGRSL
eukprot:TRINITY_DN39030_c0_g1_i1.p2 TRINITY_DN39030_c0_g1~~TRINITY_DN39030_c0_g1_i1.p2  ORF type:complete len:173 (+),score=32.16 TRINITY_DN39030_c0_g1_i1:215-733(+)